MKLRYYIHILFIIWMVAQSASSATIVHSRRIKASDGLPSNTVRCMYEDKQGFLWFGTINGLSRYDGNTFLNFQLGGERPMQDENDITLADNRIFTLKEDLNDCLWIQMMSEHYSCYDLRQGRFVAYAPKNQLTQNYSRSFVASNGDVWLWLDGNGAMRTRMDTKRNFQSELFKQERGNLTDNHVNFITENADKLILIGTGNGLTTVSGDRITTYCKGVSFNYFCNYQKATYLVSEKGGIYKYESGKRLIKVASISGGGEITGVIPLPRKCIILTTNGGYDFTPSNNHIASNIALSDVKNGNTFQDNKGNYWIFNKTGHLYQVQKNGTIKDLQLMPPNKLLFIDYERYDIEEASNGIIWISTYGNGIFAYHPQTGELEHFTATIDGSGIIDSDFLLCVMEDHSGDIWISSEYTGLTRLTIDDTNVTRIFPADPSLLDRSNAIRVLESMQDGSIIAGTRKGGLYTYDASFYKKENVQNLVTGVYSITTDKKGQTWWGTRGNGLKIGNKWYRHSATDRSSITNDHVFSIHCDKWGRMWIATFGGGLNLAVPQTDNSYKFRSFLSDKYGYRMIRYIAEDNKGHLWIATAEGIVIFDPNELIKNPKAYHVFSYTNGKFCSNEIRCIFRDSKNQMWIGTVGGGLTLCTLSPDGKELKYTQYTTSQGLVNNVIQAIQEDRYGHLWVATEYGISKFTPKQSAFENYFFASETLGDVYSENCSCALQDGRLLFGTNHGITVIDPGKFKESPVNAPVILTDLYVNGTRATSDSQDSPLKQSISYSKEIRLKHYQNSIRIMFSTLNYSDNKQTKYKYYLENYEKNWSTPSSVDFADFKYLPSGTYTLHVKASNGSGVWNDKETTLEIIVKPPFYASIWAIMFYVLVCIGAAYTGYRLFMNFNRLQNRIKVEKGLTEYKLVFFTNITHEFRTPLTLMQGSLERLQRIPDLPQSIQHPLHGLEKSMNRMSRLINQLLEFRKMQNRKLALSLEETDVIAFLREIFQDFKDAAEQKQMNYHFFSSVPAYNMFIDKEKLDKITYNILSNAFKYTPSQGSIELNIHIDNNAKGHQLRIEVSDTGVGIPKDKQKELFKRFMQSSFSGNSIGIGLHLTHELVSVHKGTISYKENENNGSIFIVCIPADKSAYQTKDFLVPGNVLLKEQQEEEEVLRKQKMPIVSYDNNPTPINKQKILVIEDNEDIRQFLKEEICKYFIVETAADGKEGFEKAKQCEPDLIVCDVLMPGMNGFEVTRRLKGEINTSHIPIILLTALSSEDKHLEGIEAGADAYIPKPFSSKLLMARIFHLIEQREKLRKKFSSEPGTEHATLCTSNRDKEFVDRLTIILENNMSDPNFNVDKFAQLMKFGRTVFYRKIKGVTGYSPNEYLRIMRMKKAAELLLSVENYTVAEVAYKVGINDPFYFSKCFKAQFGISPSVYQKGEEKTESNTKAPQTDQQN